MISTVGAAGIAAAVGALAIARPAAAASFAPTDADRARLTVMRQLELTAQALYEASIDAGLDGDAGALAIVLGNNHQAYAQAIAGAAGLSAAARSSVVYDRFESAFATSDAVAWATAANELEQTFVATHTEAIPQFEGVESVNLVASILVVEARQGIVLADVAGLALDEAVLNATEATALELSTEQNEAGE
ncbi:MAG: ferritin-like domain-containing protein [Ilumatobacteraceae bacterium]